MTDELELIERDAASAGDGRTLEVRLVKWGEVATRTAEGIHESILPGAFAGVDPSRVKLEAGRHGGPLVGVATAIVEREDGAYGVFRVSETRDGDELLTYVRDGVLTDASIVARPIKSRRTAGGVVERESMDLLRLAVLERGAYPSSKVLAVRSAVEEKESEPMTEAVDLTPITDKVEAVIQRMDALDTRLSVPAVIHPDPLSKYESLGAYASAVWRGEAPDDLIMRTWADQITSQNDGVAQTGWLTDVKRIVNLGRRAINAFGGPGPLPDHGMTVTYPYLTSNNTLVAVQSTQKTEVQSARVDIDDQATTVATYAGGSDISIQLIERSSPSYLDAYQRIVANAWASVTDSAFVTALEAGSQTQLMGNAMGAAITLTTSAHADDIMDTTAAHGLSIGQPVMVASLTGGDATTAALVGKVAWVTATSFGAQTLRLSTTPGGSPVAWGTADLSAGTLYSINSTAAGLRTSLFQGSVQVETATGAPASVALAATDVFLALSGLTDVVPDYPGNPSNASGLANAGNLRMNINGLEIIHKSSVSSGKIILSNPLAARWLEDGPRWMTVDNAQKLGKDYAIYSFGAPVIYIPAGVVEMTFV